MELPRDIPISCLKGIGPKRADSFAARGIRTVEDLFYYFPRRYEDRTNFLSIADLSPGQFQTIKAVVLASGERRSFRRKGFSITKAIVQDGSGRLECVWFNQPYIKEYLRPQTEVIFYGKPDIYSGKLQMPNPEFEIVSGDRDENSLNTGRIVPVYTVPKGIGQRSFRKLVKTALDEYLGRLEDFMPGSVSIPNGLAGLEESVSGIHFPRSEASRQSAYNRLTFDEFFLFQVPLVLRKTRRKNAAGIKHITKGPLVENFIASLPFKLTQSQTEVLSQIEEDMAGTQVMQRLLQGDVGSGKTIVATIAAVMSAQGGYQTAFMVPTEILAKQHFEKISRQIEMCECGGRSSMRSSGLRIGLLTSGLAKKEKEKVLEDTRTGRLDIVIGTHALLEADVKFVRLGLVVIDEQHRFGVGQRALLPSKGVNPDVLIMTATPIPRTLAITIYGDLDISAIKSLPPGRRPVSTRWISEEKRQWLYGFIRQQVKSGRQAYVVYPLIEESFDLDLLSAEKMYNEFKSSVFPDLRVGLIHGRLKQNEQDAVMADFKSGKIGVLIATTVLEVGIDVPNASLMVVEHAERFGLSQLHQLRGRIGRGEFDSYCVLISGSRGEEARARLEAMVGSNDGFVIAEEDLRIRGPGEYFGSRQHGLTGLRIGNPLTQMHLLKRAREEAVKLVADDPGLRKKDNVLLGRQLRSRFPEYEDLMVVG